MAKRPFNDAFSKLKGLARAPGARPGCAPRAPAASRRPHRASVTEEELWSEAVAGARPMTRGADTVAPRPPRGPPVRFWHPDLDAVDALRALVSGDAPFDLADTDEFIEGRIAGIDPNLVRKLRRGEFAVQGHVDLHGLTREEAKRGGRGLPAPLAQRREALRPRRARARPALEGPAPGPEGRAPHVALAPARFARHVLAFATARPVDGGGGALYVLLRRAGR